VHTFHRASRLSSGALRLALDSEVRRLLPGRLTDCYDNEILENPIKMAPREWIRTTDLTVNSRPLYQLSYRGMRISNDKSSFEGHSI